MTDGKEGPAEPAWMKTAKRDDALRRKVLRLERQRLRNDLEEHADWLRENTPAARREWQRHQIAVSNMNGLLSGMTGTIEERLRLLDKADWNHLIAVAYKMAEQMMQRREQLRELETAPVRISGEIAVDLYREEPRK